MVMQMQDAMLKEKGISEMSVLLDCQDMAALQRGEVREILLFHNCEPLKVVIQYHK